MSASDRRGGLVFTDHGPTSPDASDIRSLRAEQFREIWGVDLDLSSSKPQGQILDSEVAVIQDKNTQLMFVVNQWNPEQAEGIYQDNICKIYFVSRKAAQPTLVYADCMGLGMVKIPAGSQVEDNAGNRYQSYEDVVIPAGGTAERIKFTCLTEGPVQCPAKSVNKIVTRVSGWDTVLNPEPGVVGNFEESRITLEKRRKKSVAKNSRGNFESVLGEIFNIPDVVSADLAENYTDVAQTLKGVTVPPHSMFISVVGGPDSDVAEVIRRKKSGGCGLVGNTSVLVNFDSVTGRSRQQAEVRFNRPEFIACRVKAVIKVDHNKTVGNIVELVQQTVFAAWNGQLELPRVEVADTVFASALYCPVNKIPAVFDLVSIQLSRPDRENGTDTPWAESFSCTLDEYPALQLENVLVEIQP